MREAVGEKRLYPRHTFNRQALEDLRRLDRQISAYLTAALRREGGLEQLKVIEELALGHRLVPDRRRQVVEITGQHADQDQNAERPAGPSA